MREGEFADQLSLIARLMDGRRSTTNILVASIQESTSKFNSGSKSWHSMINIYLGYSGSTNTAAFETATNSPIGLRYKVLDCTIVIRVRAQAQVTFPPWR